MTPLSPARSKARSNKSHARARGMERYGLDLDGPALDRLANLILAHDPETLTLAPSRRRNRRWVAVKIGETWYPVVFDDATETIMTFLPERCLDRWRATLEPAPEPVAVPVRPVEPPSGVGDGLSRVPPKPPKFKHLDKSVTQAIQQIGDALDSLVTLEQLDNELLRLDASIDVLTKRMAGVVTRQARGPFQAEICRIGQWKKRVRIKRHEVYMADERRLQIDAADIDDPNNPHCLLIAAYREYKSFGLALVEAGVPESLSEQTKATFRLIAVYLKNRRSEQTEQRENAE